MTIENYKNVVIGRGEGGKYLAWHLAQSGQKTAVIELRWVGGSCPNVNCLPSKNEIVQRYRLVAAAIQESAHVEFRETRDAELPILLYVDKFVKQQSVRERLVRYLHV